MERERERERIADGAHYTEPVVVTNLLTKYNQGVPAQQNLIKNSPHEVRQQVGGEMEWVCDWQQMN